MSKTVGEALKYLESVLNKVDEPFTKIISKMVLKDLENTLSDETLTTELEEDEYRSTRLTTHK